MPEKDKIKNTVNPVILLASARKNSDTEKFLEVVFHDIKHARIDLLDFHISAYDYSHNYPAGDNFIEITERILEHDRIIFATPVYWYSMSGLMKTFFDRFTDLVTIHKTTGRKLSGKYTYLFAAGADPSLPPGFEVPFQLTSEYLDMVYKGCLYCSTKHPNTGSFLKEQKEFINKITNHLNKGISGK